MDKVLGSISSMFSFFQLKIPNHGLEGLQTKIQTCCKSDSFDGLERKWTFERIDNVLRRHASSCIWQTTNVDFGLHNILASSYTIRNYSIPCAMNISQYKVKIWVIVTLTWQNHGCDSSTLINQTPHTRLHDSAIYEQQYGDKIK